MMIFYCSSRPTTFNNGSRRLEKNFKLHDFSILTCKHVIFFFFKALEELNSRLNKGQRKGKKKEEEEASRCVCYRSNTKGESKDFKGDLMSSCLLDKSKDFKGDLMSSYLLDKSKR